MSHLGLVKCLPTVICIRNDCNSGWGKLWAQTPPHGHAEGDGEAFLVLVQRVVDDHHPAGLLHLPFVKTQDAVMVLGPGDVIRVGEHPGGDGARGRNWSAQETESKLNGPKSATWKKIYIFTLKSFFSWTMFTVYASLNYRTLLGLIILSTTLVNHFRLVETPESEQQQRRATFTLHGILTFTDTFNEAWILITAFALPLGVLQAVSYNKETAAVESVMKGRPANGFTFPFLPTHWLTVAVETYF